MFLYYNRSLLYSSFIAFFHDKYQWSGFPSTHFSHCPFVSIALFLFIDYSKIQSIIFPSFFLMDMYQWAVQTQGTGVLKLAWAPHAECAQQEFNSKATRINTSLSLVLILSLLMVDVCCQNSWKASAVICYSGYGDFNEQSRSYVWDHLQNPLPSVTRENLEIFHMEKQPNTSCCTVFSFTVGLLLP